MIVFCVGLFLLSTDIPRFCKEDSSQQLQQQQQQGHFASFLLATLMIAAKAADFTLDAGTEKSLDAAYAQVICSSFLAIGTTDSTIDSIIGLLLHM